VIKTFWAAKFLTKFDESGSQSKSNMAKLVTIDRATSEIASEQRKKKVLNHSSET